MRIVLLQRSELLLAKIGPLFVSRLGVSHLLNFGNFCNPITEDLSLG